MTDFILGTRDQEYILLTPARFSRDGVVELAIERELPDGVRAETTILTAAQARTLASALDAVARDWGA